MTNPQPRTLARLASRRATNVPPLERALSAGAGAALLLRALRRRSFAGGLLAWALLSRGASGRSAVYSKLGVVTDPDAPRGLLKRPIALAASTTIARPRAEVVRFWRDVQELARAVPGVEGVREVGEGTSDWTARVGDRTVRWRARSFEDVPERSIRWESLPGSDIEHRGRVSFADAPGGRGTEVVLEAFWSAPVTALAAAGRLLRTAPQTRARETLRRAKQLLEAGELPTSGGVSAREADVLVPAPRSMRPTWRSKDLVQEASEESFPASDPPAWTP